MDPTGLQIHVFEGLESGAVLVGRIFGAEQPQVCGPLQSVVARRAAADR